jgi:CO dehydrogenase nickel-insertion accessory protein CooC1
LDAQEKNIRDYAPSQGWDLIEIYMDAEYMARCGNRVLLIDLDPHWQCATSLGIDRPPSPLKKTLEG